MRKKLEDHLAQKMAKDIDDELIKIATMPSMTATEAITGPVTLETIRESAKFIPEIWSKKIFNKFYDEMILPNIGPYEDVFGRSRQIKRLTEQIKGMADQGMTPEEIAEKIDPEPDTVKILKKGEIGRMERFKIYGTKVIKPEGHGILGTTS